MQIFRDHLYHQFFTDELFKLLSLDQFLCADENHERTVGRSQHTVDLVDTDIAVLCRLLGGQCHFQIVGSGVFAEAVPVKHDGDADFQDAVKNAAVIQIGSLFHNGKRDIRGDDHGLA